MLLWEFLFICDLLCWKMIHQTHKRKIIQKLIKKKLIKTPKPSNIKLEKSNQKSIKDHYNTKSFEVSLENSNLSIRKIPHCNCSETFFAMPILWDFFWKISTVSEFFHSQIKTCDLGLRILHQISRSSINKVRNRKFTRSIQKPKMALKSSCCLEVVWWSKIILSFV